METEKKQHLDLIISGVISFVFALIMIIFISDELINGYGKPGPNLIIFGGSMLLMQLMYGIFAMHQTKYARVLKALAIVEASVLVVLTYIFLAEMNFSRLYNADFEVLAVFSAIWILLIFKYGISSLHAKDSNN